MAKINRPGSQKSGSDNAAANEKQKQQGQLAGSHPTPVTRPPKGKQGGKSHKPTIGGTAIHGARSTQPKEISTGSPAEQQAESYNREMRRRMQHMGTGPYSERATMDPRERRRKRKERLKERQEQIRHTVDAKGPSRDIKLGRRNTLFLIGVVAAVLLLIVLFLIIKRPF